MIARLITAILLMFPPLAACGTPREHFDDMLSTMHPQAMSFAANPPYVQQGGSGDPGLYEWSWYAIALDRAERATGDARYRRLAEEFIHEFAQHDGEYQGATWWMFAGDDEPNPGGHQLTYVQFAAAATGMCADADLPKVYGMADRYAPAPAQWPLASSQDKWTQWADAQLAAAERGIAGAEEKWQTAWDIITAGAYRWRIFTAELPGAVWIYRLECPFVISQAPSHPPGWGRCQDTQHANRLALSAERAARLRPSPETLERFHLLRDTWRYLRSSATTAEPWRWPHGMDGTFLDDDPSDNYVPMASIGWLDVAPPDDARGWCEGVLWKQADPASPWHRKAGYNDDAPVNRLNLLAALMLLDRPTTRPE